MELAIRKLALAEYRAKGIGLEGTGDRLEILRKRLEEYKDLPEGKRDERLRWAVSKIEDTRRALEKELNDPDCIERRKERQSDNATMATLAKAAMFIGAIGAGIELAKVIGMLSPMIMFPAAFIATKFINWFMGVHDPNASVRKIQSAIDECRQSVEDFLR